MAWWQGLDECLSRDVPLRQLTWLRLGGPAEFFAVPRTFEELGEIVRRARQEQLPLRILGGGSNVLVPDEGVKGIVVQLSAADFLSIEIRDEHVTAGAGARLGHVVANSVREGLAGLETLVGIPGTVGGALHGNAGGRGGDIGQWVAKARVMTRAGEIVERDRAEFVFEYRQSNFEDQMILSADFSLERENPDELTKRMQKQWIVKKGVQPLAHQHCANVFKNPRGMSAGILIEQSGLKGSRVGGAEVSERHANFIVADSRATSGDVLKLIELVRERVRSKQGIELEMELEVW